MADDEPDRCQICDRRLTMQDHIAQMMRDLASSGIVFHRVDMTHVEIQRAWSLVADMQGC